MSLFILIHISLGIESFCHYVPSYIVQYVKWYVEWSLTLSNSIMNNFNIEIKPDQNKIKDIELKKKQY